ncbi:MAG: GAF domain-containing protein, partial [Chloroflexi bacterium]|nr:GAF domain-containing protein [Chloroflexota bacterium]
MPKARILIVEDEAILAMDLQSRMANMGYPLPEVVHSGEDAISKARETRPDLILMDIMLSGKLDGIMAADQIRGFLDTPIIFVTAYADQETLQRAKITEPCGYIVKPLNEKEVNAVIEMVLYKHATQTELRKLNGLLLTTREINQLIVKVDDEAELLHRVCAILVDGRNYKLAWVGFITPGSYDVRPAAQAGFEDGYLSSVKITWDDSQYGKGPVGTAIKTGHPSVRRDILNDKQFSPAREQALKRGYASSAALPLYIRDKIIGTLNVYAGKSDAFDDTEIAMLVELAGDISAGIERIRQQEQLRQSEERYRTTLDGMLEGCQIIDFNWRYIYLNDTAVGHSQSIRETLLGRTMMEIYPGIENTDMFAHARRCLDERIPHRMENMFTFPDGSQKWFDLSIEPVSQGVLILSIDITEHKQAEEALQKAHGELRNIYDTVADVIFVLGVESSGRYRFTSVNPAFY